MKKDIKFNKIALFSLIAIFTLAIAGYTVFWFVTSNQIKKDIEINLSKAQDLSKQKGIELSYGSISSQGFPFSRSFLVSDVKFGYNAGSSGNLNYTASKIKISAPVLIGKSNKVEIVDSVFNLKSLKTNSNITYKFDDSILIDVDISKPIYQLFFVDDIKAALKTISAVKLILPSNISFDSDGKKGSVVVDKSNPVTVFFKINPDTKYFSFKYTAGNLEYFVDGAKKGFVSSADMSVVHEITQNDIRNIKIYNSQGKWNMPMVGLENLAEESNSKEVLGFKGDKFLIDMEISVPRDPLAHTNSTGLLPASFKLKDFLYKFGDSEISMNATFNTDKDDKYAYGKLDVKINSYDSIIKALTKFSQVALSEIKKHKSMSIVSADLDFSNNEIESYGNAIANILTKINQNKENAKNFNLTIIREKNSQLKIGDLNVVGFMAIVGEEFMKVSSKKVSSNNEGSATKQ